MTELKNLMRDMAARARTYDMTEKAIKVSRRRRVMVRVVAPAVAAVAVTLVVFAVRTLPNPTPSPPLVPPSVPPPVACDLTRLQLPGNWEQSHAMSISPNQRFIGGHVSTGDGMQTPVIWDNGIPLLLPMSGRELVVRQVADNGDAIGFYFEKPDDRDPRSFLWRDGHLIALNGRDASASAFNSSWAVVGAAEGKGAIWRDVSKEPDFLRVPDTTWRAYPISIDDTGQVLGILDPVRGTDQEVQMASWSPSGELRIFPRPPQLGEQWELSPIKFSDGDVFFQAYDETGATAMLGWWDPRTNAYLLTPKEGPASQTVAANGWRLVHDGARSFVEGAGSRVELVKPADSDGVNVWAYSMADDGHTIVTSLRLHQQGHIAAVMWRCR
jgi:hypothetical protein